MTNDLLPGTEVEARGLRWELVDAQPAGAQQRDLERTQCGLERAQFERVLGTFGHKSYPRAPELCLAAFDELKQLGLETFCGKHDPYWDIPLVETLAEPVIDLPTGQLPASTAKPTKPSANKPPTAQTELLFGQADASPAPAPSADIDTVSSAAPSDDLGELKSAPRHRRRRRAPVPHRLIEEGRAEKQGKARGTKYVAVREWQ